MVLGRISVSLPPSTSNERHPAQSPDDHSSVPSTQNLRHVATPMRLWYTAVRCPARFLKPLYFEPGWHFWTSYCASHQLCCFKAEAGTVSSVSWRWPIAARHISTEIPSVVERTTSYEGGLCKQCECVDPGLTLKQYFFEFGCENGAKHRHPWKCTSRATSTLFFRALNNIAQPHNTMLYCSACFWQFRANCAFRILRFRSTGCNVLSSTSEGS